MSTRKISSYFIPSVADIIFVSIFLYLSLSKGQDLLSDADTGYHIRAGEHIINTFSIPRHDLFSFITPTIPWTAHEWLSEIIMSVLHKGFGLTGVVVFHALLIALVYYLMMKQLRHLNGNIFIAAAIVILAATSSQIHWLARPHIYSLLIMVIWYRLLDDFQYREKDRLFWLPIMMLLWVNLHGGYLAGFILLGIYCVGNYLMSFQSGSDDRAILRCKSLRILKISIVSLLVSLANPIGYKILIFPFSLVNNKYIMDHVTEFISPNFHEPMIFKYLFIITFALLVYSRKKLNLIELMLLVVFTHMALFAVRYVTLFAIVSAPIIIGRSDDLLASTNNRFTEFIKLRAARFASTDGMACGYGWPLAACLSVLLLLPAYGIDYQFSEKLKPVAAVEFLKKEHISGNMYNNDEFGDYIIYAAWPTYRVFFDGRIDMYGAAHMKNYYRVLNFEPGWENVLDKYDIDWMIFDAKASLSRYLLASGGWQLIYADKVAHIFVKDIPKYRYLIEKYKKVRPIPVTEDEKSVGLYLHNTSDTYGTEHSKT